MFLIVTAPRSNVVRLVMPQFFRNSNGLLPRASRLQPPHSPTAVSNRYLRNVCCLAKAPTGSETGSPNDRRNAYGAIAGAFGLMASATRAVPCVRLRFQSTMVLDSIDEVGSIRSDARKVSKF